MFIKKPTYYHIVIVATIYRFKNFNSTVRVEIGYCDGSQNFNHNFIHSGLAIWIITSYKKNTVINVLYDLIISSCNIINYLKKNN